MKVKRSQNKSWRLGGDFGLPSWLWYLTQLGRQSCQFYTPAALYLQGNSLVLVFDGILTSQYLSIKHEQMSFIKILNATYVKSHALKKKLVSRNENVFFRFVDNFPWVWSDSDRASSLICGNKMATRCNRWFLLQILLLACVYTTLSSTPYRKLENQSTKYHRQRPSV